MMRMFFVGLLILLIAMSFDANAQFKPAEQQYLSKENLAKNSGFEQGKAGWTNANGTFSLSPTEKISGNNGGCVSLTAQTLDFSQTLTTGYNANLASLQGQVSAYAKADFAFQVCSLVDGVEQNCLNNSGLNAFDWYGLPTVLSSTSLGIKFKTSGNVTGTFCTDDIDFGAKQISQAIAQGEYLGYIDWAGAISCAWSVSSTPFADYAVDSDCSNPTTKGVVKAPLTKIPALILPSGSPSGTYQFIAQGMFYKGGGVTQYAGFRFSDGTIHSNNNNVYLNAQTIGNVLGSITYDSSLAVDTLIKMQGYSIGGTAEIYANIESKNLRIDVYYTPPKSHIVAQNLEKTVQNSNEFSAKVSSTGVVSGENLDWINGNCSQPSGTGTYSCSYNSSIFTVAPNCSVQLAQTSNTFAAITSSTSSLLAWRATDSGGTFFDRAHEIICQKQGVDFNKSQIVHGTFEQIETTDLCTVEAFQNDAESVTLNTEDIPWKTEVSDPCNLWTNAGNTGGNTNDAYTARLDGNILLTGIFFTNSATVGTNNITVFKNGVDTNTQCGIVDDTTFQMHFSCIVPVVVGDVVTLRSSVTKTLNATVAHRIVITELPNLAGIVKNLNDNKNVKCQTKYLSANYTSGNTNSLSDLLFQNLTLGKRYEATYNVSSVGSIGFIRHNSIQVLQVAVNTSPNATISQSSVKFKAVGGNVEFGVSNNSGGTPLFGDGTTSQTWAELCELPDNYIETTEF